MKNTKDLINSKFYKIIKKKIIYILVLLFVILISETVYCLDKNVSDINELTLHYYKIDNNSIDWAEKVYTFPSNDFEANVNNLLTILFESGDIPCIPENTKFINATVIDDHIIINISSEILNHGGNLYESVMLSQIFKTGLNLPNINYVTILINGKYVYMPEGIVTFYVSEFDTISY